MYPLVDRFEEQTGAERQKIIDKRIEEENTRKREEERIGEQKRKEEESRIAAEARLAAVASEDLATSTSDPVRIQSWIISGSNCQTDACS